MTRAIDKVRQKLGDSVVTEDESGIRAYCPAHGGSLGNPSFQVYARDDGSVYLQCFAGCTFRDILKGLSLSGDDLKGHSSEIKYPYCDRDGQIIGYAIRKQTGRSKTFLQAALIDGKLIYKDVYKRCPELQTTLYRLPEVLAAIETGATVYVVEGEKDADRLADMGEVGTCNIGGAGKWRDDHAEWLKGAARVVIIADNDVTGARHAVKVADSLRALLPADTVSVLRGAVADDKSDLSDHLDNGYTLADLIPLAETSQSARGENADDYFNRDGVLIADLTDSVEEISPLATDEAGTIVQFADGYWQADGERAITNRVFHILGNRFRKSHATNVATIIAARPALLSEDSLDTRYLNVPSGLVEWRTGSLYPHDPAVPSRNRIPVNWNPAAECPNTDKWIAETVGADALDFVYEVIGYCLYNGNPLHKAILLYGSGRNGKGTLLRLVKALLGKDNISAVTPQSLDENRFMKAELYGKLANLVGDVDPKIFRATESFKQVTGEDLMTAERKNQHPFGFTSRATIIAAFNQLPRTADGTEGFFSRWVVVPFTGYFPAGVADPSVEQGLHDELEGILVKATSGLRNLMMRGHFSYPESVVKATEEFKTVADPVRSFIAECVSSGDGFVTRRELYRAYKSYAEDNGNHPVSQTVFTQRFKEAAPGILGKPIEESKRGGYEGFKNIAHGNGMF